MHKSYDLVIAGAGPAGCGAAIVAGQLGLRTLLLDRESFPRRPICAGWIGPAGVSLCESLGLTQRAAGAVRFSGMRLISWDLKRTAPIDDAALFGWVVDRSKFEKALGALARQAGAQSLLDAEITGVDCREQGVLLRCPEGREVAGRAMIIADGLNSSVARLAGVPSAAASPELTQCVLVELPARKAPAALEAVIGSSRLGQTAALVHGRPQTCIAAAQRGEPSSALPQLRDFVRRAADSNGARSELEMRTAATPAGAALELDTHVGKHCLLVGAAGGFVSTFSNEGIYPGMKSGVVAARTVFDALRARHVQDELATFDSRWRSELADYLRPPHTDLSLLMPLVFGNAQMSSRVARAFLLGEAI